MIAIYIYRKISAPKVVPKATIEVELDMQKSPEPEILVGPELTGETQVTYISTVSVHTPKWEFDVECPGTSLRSLKFKDDTDADFEVEVEEPALTLDTSRPEIRCNIELENPNADGEVPREESMIGDGTDGRLTLKSDA